jgi:hypothetical protein
MKKLLVVIGVFCSLSAFADNASLGAKYTCISNTVAAGRIASQQVFILTPGSLFWLYPVGPKGYLMEFNQISEAMKRNLGEPAVSIEQDMTSGEIAVRTWTKEKIYSAPPTLQYEYIFGDTISQSKVFCIRQKSI